MAMTMQEFLVLADADLDKIWHEDETPFETQYTKVMNVLSQSDLYKRDAKMTGFGPMYEIPEGGNVQYDTAIAPVTKRYDLVKRGLGYKITDKLWRFDRYGEVKKFEGDLRRADAHDTEQFFFSIFNNADQPVYTGFDGLPLASTAHTRLDGGPPLANRPTVYTALSLTALEDAVIAFTKLLDDRGRPYLSQPRRLIIPLDLVLVAEEILGSALRPDTANNATNALRNRFNLTPVATPYITSPTFWMLQGDKHDVNALWNMRPTQSSEIDFDSDTIKRKSIKWMGRGFGEWRGHYLGSN